jgi:hypothetical protein
MCSNSGTVIRKRHHFGRHNELCRMPGKWLYSILMAIEYSNIDSDNANDDNDE